MLMAKPPGTRAHHSSSPYPLALESPFRCYLQLVKKLLLDTPFLMLYAIRKYINYQLSFCRPSLLTFFVLNSNMHYLQRP